MAKRGNPSASEVWKRRVTLLFREMAEDLSTVLAGKQNVILCPLCLSEFTENDISPETLSEEHIIPQSAGGIVKTLTCKACNNTAGHDIEGDFARLFRIESARHGGGKVDARIKVTGGVGSPAQVSFTSEGMHVRLSPTTEYAKREMVEHLRQHATGEREMSLKMVNNIDTTKPTASIVKMAYLALFKDWGYKYVLLPNRDWVRKGIRFDCEEREWLSSLVIPMTITDASDLPETPTRISFETNCDGINVACSIIRALPGLGSILVILPPMFDMSVGHHAGLERAAQSILGRSLTVDFEPGRLPTIRGAS
jgi:hypothetical protein